jgi:hypothetical protein
MRFKRFFSARIFAAAALVALSVFSFSYVSAMDYFQRGKKNKSVAEVTLKDSLKVLCTIYDKKGSSTDNVLTISAIVDCDSTKAPMYVVGDSVVTFFSEIRADAVKNMRYLKDKKQTKQYGKDLPNGVLILDLEEGEDYTTCQAIPAERNLTRQSFVTKMTLNQIDNRDGTFAQKLRSDVELYGTDDVAFRNYSYKNPNGAPVLVADSLNHKAFVDSFNDIKNGFIETMTAYSGGDAVQVIGDKGVNGLVIVLVKPPYTIQQAIYNMAEKMWRTDKELMAVNKVILDNREPIKID